jgi:benzodiazapine receptor
VACAAGPGIFIRPGSWYRTIAKPAWRPPDWLFGPVWLVLYLTIAVAGWLVWRDHGLTGAAAALAIYVVQLVLNALWSVVFFGVHRIGWAAAELAVLWLSILAAIVAFHPLSPTAAYLLVPYLVWVTFALTLNLAIWRLNRCQHHD